MIPWFSAGLTPIDAGETSVEECRGCHPSVASAWSGSAHASARTNPAFSVAYDEARDPWCLNCHLPLRAQRGPAPSVPASEGVGCGACHVRDGAILTSSPASSAAKAAHAVREVPDFATVVCEGCHEFPFPLDARAVGAPPQYGLSPLQSTVSEWRSVAGAPPCTTCHGHGAPGGADAAFVLRSLGVEVTTTATGVRATLSAPGVPHTVPTGDPFRRLTLTTADDQACARPIASAVFGRRIVDLGPSLGIGGLTVIPPAGARTVELTGRAAFWCLTADRVDPSHVGRVPASVASIPLASGRVAPSR